MPKTIEQSFADWHGDVFGFGYGSGEQYTLPALRRFLELCNGGDSGQYDYRELERELGPVVAWLLINALCRADILEYGSSPRFAWLTRKGQSLKRFALSQDIEALMALTSRSEDDEVCYPDACNCDGYVKGKVCVNPFWQDDAARAFLQDSPSNPVASDSRNDRDERLADGPAESDENAP